MSDDDSMPGGASPGEPPSTAAPVSFEKLASGSVLDEENDIEVHSRRHTAEYRHGSHGPVEYSKSYWLNGKGAVGISVTVDSGFEAREEVAEHLRKALEVMDYDPVEVETT